jgi:acyl-CoA reductase-like NAD-dependent aldehyde dehydrogenase
VVPPGVVNVIVDDNDLGPLLTAHPDVRKITFTGSTETGQRIMASAAPTLKRLTLELGGNDAAIVFEDVDCSAVARLLFHAAFRNNGQACTATKRIYVAAPIYDAFCDELEKHARGARVGEGSEAGVQFGPLQNKRQYDRVLDLIRDAMARGARIVGGEAEPQPGYFVRPAIVRDVADDAPVVAHEQFGPVLPVLRFTDADDVIRRVNAGDYGLCASVWSGDAARARAVAAELEVGTVNVNKLGQPGADIPFAGAKFSGVGVENGIEGLQSFTQLQLVDVAR